MSAKDLYRSQRSLGMGNSNERRIDDRSTHRCAFRSRSKSRLKTKENYDGQRSTPGNPPEESRSTMARIQHWSLAKRDQRPRLHSAELRAIRRRRIISSGPNAAHKKYLGPVEPALCRR